MAPRISPSSIDFSTLSTWTAAAPYSAESGFLLAYVLQDGAETLDLPTCQVVSLTGSDRWRTQHGAALIARARTEGDGRVPVGRVNCARRVQACQQLGADSVDGTHLAYKGVRRGVQDVSGWLAQAAHPTLW